MLKKISYAIIASGLLLAPLAASAMISNTPFPACYGVECWTPAHAQTQTDTIRTASESPKFVGSHKQSVEAPARANDSPFPFDNSND